MIRRTTRLLSLKHPLNKTLIRRSFAFRRRDSEYPREVNSNFINTQEYETLTLKKPLKKSEKSISGKNILDDEEEEEEEEIYYKVHVDYLKEVEARVV